ncbi:unnamed protein product [Discula destructiva]
MAWKTAWTAVLAVCAGDVLAEHALRTKFTVSELQSISDQDAALESTFDRESGLTPGDAAVQDTNPSLLYPAYNLSVPIDHFHNDSLYEPHPDGTFNLRYWFDASYYREGGPVIVLQSGETSGVGRLPYLQKGIVNILARATGGLGVILEHRYYGKSFPVDSLDIESMRFLTTEQAVADMAYFAQHVQFEGLEHQNLTSPNVPYIAYGGSYAGAFVAILRKAYPDVYWGAISSSGVTAAIYDFWQYFEAARLYAPGDCAVNTAKITNVIDNILIGQDGTSYVQQLKDLFGLGNLTRSVDFANTVAGGGIGGLQSTNWDPALNYTGYGAYCDLVSNQSLTDSALASQRDSAVELLNAAGYAAETDTLLNPLLNFVGYTTKRIPARCPAGYSQDYCFSNSNETFHQQDDITQTWRSWPYQYCFEWGYLMTGSGAPQDQLPLISRLEDLHFEATICREAFNMTQPPQVERINRWGGFNFSYPRLAIVDGEHDPWRQATPHAIGLPERVSTTTEPFYLIPAAVHHWDENGLFPNETTDALPPQSIKDVQAEEVAFVRAWLEEWKQAKSHTNWYSSAVGELEL